MNTFAPTLEKRLIIGKPILFPDKPTHDASPAEIKEKMQYFMANFKDGSPYSTLLFWCETKYMFCRYKEEGGACLKKSDGEIIKGFNFDSNDFERLIDPKKLNNPIIDKNVEVVTRLFIMPGIRRDNNEATLIVTRVGADGNIKEDVAIEYCFPCPDECPKNIAKKEDVEKFCKDLECKGDPISVTLDK